MKNDINQDIKKMLDDIYNEQCTAVIEYFTHDWVRVDILKKHLKKLLRKREYNGT